MFALLIFLLSYGLFYTSVESNVFTGNGINENYFTYAEIPYGKSPNIDALHLEDQLVDFPLIKLYPEKTSLQFAHPLTSVNIDFEKNAVLSEFRKDEPLFEAKEKVGNSGKRHVEKVPLKYLEEEEDDQRRNERSTSGARDPRGDNFMRFGRAPHEDFMRFGRKPHEDFMRFGRSPNEDFMRFGRSPNEDFMRFGRKPHEDFMRFGRNPYDSRLRRDPGSDFMRLGRSGGLVDKSHFLRNAKTAKSNDRDLADDFMRFGRSAVWPNDLSKHPNKNIERKQPKTD